MAWVSGDRVKETTTTAGTGDLTLAGAVAGFRAFSAVCANLDEFYYAIVDGSAWEVGRGRWNTGGTVTRLQVLSSSTGALVNFSGSSKEIWIDYPADHGLMHPQIRVQTMDRYIHPNTSVVVAEEYEVASGKELELGDGAVMEVT